MKSLSYNQPWRTLYSVISETISHRVASGIIWLDEEAQGDLAASITDALSLLDVIVPPDKWKAS